MKETYGLASGRAVQLIRPACIILKLLRAVHQRTHGDMDPQQSINTPDSYGRTPLHYAAESGDLPVLSLLVGAGNFIFCSVGHDMGLPFYLEGTLNPKKMYVSNERALVVGA